MSFSRLGLSPSFSKPLARLGYEQPTPIQVQAIPVVLGGGDLIARAQTGTGKTAAFGLPMIDRLLVRNPRPAVARKPRGLVLVPTRELAQQVRQALAGYGAAVRLHVTAIYGGVPTRPQTQALQQGTDIVVATPGRLLDHLQQRSVDLSAVEILVLDEADRMLDMGFLPPVGVGLAIASGIARVDLDEVTPVYVPYLVALLIGLVLIAVFPVVTLILPRLLLGYGT